MQAKVIRVIADNHTFTRVPFALSFAVPGIESFGDDYEFFDEPTYAKIKESAKALGIRIETDTRHYDGHLTLSHGRLYKF